MLRLLRTLVRAIAGKVDAGEVAAGLFFGVALVLLPAAALDPGSGLLGWNGLWLLLVLALLLFRASIPVALGSGALLALAGRAGLDRLAWRLGRFVLDDLLPRGLVQDLQDRLPALQLHTYPGMGGAVLGLAGGGTLGLLAWRWLRRRLPAWRERWSRSRLVRALGGFLPFRVLGWLLR